MTKMFVVQFSYEGQDGGETAYFKTREAADAFMMHTTAGCKAHGWTEVDDA